MTRSVPDMLGQTAVGQTAVGKTAVGKTAAARAGLGNRRRRSLVLATLLLVQGMAAVFFLADAFTDLRDDPLGPPTIVEALVAIALVSGIYLTAWQLRLTLEEMRQQERSLDTARGDLAKTIRAQFEAWRLTPAERDVGLLALKGLDVAEIAALRSAAPGTVRAQLARIYSKAGVSGRAQFAAWFVEDLLHDGVRA